MMQIKCKTGTKKLSLSKVVQIMLKYNKQKGISEPSEEKSPPQAKIFLDFAKYLSEKGISLTFHDLPPPKKINP